MRQSKSTIVLIVLSALLASACLKTRAQIKRDSDSGDPVEDGIKMDAPSQVDPQAGAVDELKGELNQIQSRISELEQKSESPEAQEQAKRLEEDLRRLENRMIEIEQTQVAILDSIKNLKASLPPPDPEQVFKKGKSSFDKKRYKDAITSFNIYLQEKKVANRAQAYFYRAESYFNLKEYKKAILDYSRFPEKFQKSKLVPPALYKIGLSFGSLGLKDDARVFYQELVDRHSKTKEGKLARKKLGLKPKPKKKKKKKRGRKKTKKKKQKQ